MASAEPTQGTVPDNETIPAPQRRPDNGRIIPATGQVVILREAELDTDLPTAIQRVRAQGETSQSRILIIAPDEPTAVPDPGALPEPDMPTSVLQAVRAGGEQALSGFGARCQPLLDTIGRFFEETRWVLEELDEAAEEGILARIKSRVRVGNDILGWIQCALDELAGEVGAACQGLGSVDLAELVRETSGHIESFFPGVRVTVAAAPEAMTVTGRATELAEACFLVLLLTAHRIGGEGSVTVEFARKRDQAGLRIVGLGEPRQVRAPAAMERLRQIVVRNHGGWIRPDALGPFGTGIQVGFPAS